MNCGRLQRSNPGRPWPWVLFALGIACLAALPVPAQGARVTLKSGFELEGDIARLGTMVAGPAGSDDASGNLIVFCDDGLRRTYVGFGQVKQADDTAGEVLQKINVPQPVAEGGREVTMLGPFVEKPTELDAFGRRRIRIQLQDGQADIVQGVILVTPRYFQLRTLNVGQRLLLDQRYATSNLTSQQLSRVLDYALKDQKPEIKRNAVRLYVQADRFSDAQRELEKLLKSQPKMEGLSDMLQELRQQQARTVLRELRLRREAGQHQLVRGILEHFPSEGIAGETLFEVRKLVEQYMETDQQMAALKKDIQSRLKGLKDETTRQQLRPLVDEICADLSISNLARLASYRRLSGDAAMSDNEKLSLAISGWLVGTDEATNNLPATLSLVTVRRVVREYLNESLKTKRSHLIDELRSQQSASTKLIARLMAAMKPCVAPPEPVAGVPGYYEITVPGRDKEPDTTYYVQTPPDYDPYRRYPAILSLHGLATDGPKQIDWWCGAAGAKGDRQGQAMRQGYIVIAPQWTKDGQKQYEYSAREHTVVLDVLRDACRRFSVDTDRVFLSGHAMGGDAAWDLGQAHPDLWAGVIPLVATSDSNKYRYCQLYWQNAQYVPTYFVAGQFDGAKMAKNAALYDRYLRSTRFDCTVVEFQGRGHESFSDEIVRIFDWTSLHKRSLFPKDSKTGDPSFECATIRSFDNYFWWIEINRFPPGVAVDPEDWPGRNLRTLKISSSIRRSGDVITVHANTGRGPTTIWLSPELVDFSKRVRIVGRREVAGPRPDVETLLEDVRSRGDRQHPFWARVDCP